jgi:hypothetical protein
MFSKGFFIPGSIFLSLVVVIMIHWWGYRSPSIGIDDANIYFVYMKNFADGHGFVWNIGGERVEGFTSLLWTLFGAFTYALTPVHFTKILLVTNFVLIFLTLRSVLIFSRRLNGTEQKPFAATDIIILSLLILPLGFIEWGITALMETGLWCFLLVQLTLQLCLFYLKDGKFSITKFSIMVVLLDLTRPESLALSVLFIGLLFIIVLMERNMKQALRLTAMPFILHIATLISILAWRLSYFGYPFPNTYYAKISGDKVENALQGIKYLLYFFYSYPHAAFTAAVLIVFIILLAIRLLREGFSSFTRAEKIMAVLLIVIFTGLALPILTGGDHFRYSRFYQPFLPLMYVAVTCTFFWKERLGFNLVHDRMAVLGLALPIAFSAIFFSKFTILDFLKNRNSINYNILMDFAVANTARKLGDSLNVTFGGFKYPTLGALATGSVAYSYKGKTIDLLGLNNTVMAHSNSIKVGYRNHASFDKSGFWKLRPDILGTFMGAEVVADTTLFVLPENNRSYRTSDFTYLCFKGIFDDADFRDVYVPALVKLKGRNHFIFSYYNKKFLSSLNSTGNYVIKVLERKRSTRSPDPLTVKSTDR